MELGPNQELWLKALESGNFQQGHGSLNKDNKFCCLGVACEVFNAPKSTVEVNNEKHYYINDEDEAHITTTVAPLSIVQKLKLNNSAGSIERDETNETNYYSLIHLNDIKRMPFKDIAQFIRENPDKVFTESA